MLNLLIYLPLATAVVVLALPGASARLVRRLSLAGGLATLALALWIWAGYDTAAGSLQWSFQRAWVPSVGASYHLAVDGLSLPLVLLTALLFSLVFVFVLGETRAPRAHAALFLFMETGLLGLFCAQDLLLFYVFFEVALVPMYFIIGLWGGERRRYAAVKFFLYTRTGSLLMLLAFLGLYLSVEPHSFALADIVGAGPIAESSRWSGLILFGLLAGFGVKLPTWPIHNWLPDAHVEAPTEGSVILAGIQLKMGGYGMLRVLFPVASDSADAFAWILVALGLVSLLWGSLAALAQSDFKRLVAYSSVNHMGFVLLGAGAAILASDPALRTLALGGAALQLVSHGLLTGGMFFMAGILQHRHATRELSRIGGLMRTAPGFGFLLALLCFGSLGLPGLSGFVAELQVLGGVLGVARWAAVVSALGVLVTTGLYLKVVVSLLMGDGADEKSELEPVPSREMIAVVPLGALSVVIGVYPDVVMSLIESAFRAAVGGGG